MNDPSMAQPDPLESSELTFLLGEAYQAILAESDAELMAAGYPELPPLHGMAFQVLQARGTCTSGELGEALGLSTQAAAQLVKDLDRRGYLCRGPGPGGGRNVLWVMTDKAQQQLRAAGYVLARLEGRLADKIGAEAMGDLRAYLAQVIRIHVGDDVPPLRPLW